MIFEIQPPREYVIEEFINEISISKDHPDFKSFNGKCTIEIYGNEGTYIPHFHIKAENFSCCIQLFDNRFFTHGIHKDILLKDDWKTLDTWLRKNNRKYPSMSNWGFAVSMWNAINNTNYDNDKDSQPDYTIIKQYKG